MYWSWDLFASSTSNAVVYSWQSELFSWIWNFWKTAFMSFWDSFKYYLFWDALSSTVVTSFVSYMFVILGVWFVASYLFYKYRN